MMIGHFHPPSSQIRWPALLGYEPRRCYFFICAGGTIWCAWDAASNAS